MTTLTTFWLAWLFWTIFLFLIFWKFVQVFSLYIIVIQWFVHFFELYALKFVVWCQTFLISLFWMEFNYKIFYAIFVLSSNYYIFKQTLPLRKWHRKSFDEPICVQFNKSSLSTLQKMGFGISCKNSKIFKKCIIDHFFISKLTSGVWWTSLFSCIQ